MPKATLRRIRLILVLIAVLVSVLQATTVTGTYKVVIIQTTYSDDTTLTSTSANLNLAAGEIHDYYNKLSFGNLDVEVTIGRAALTQPKSHYWSACPSSDDADKMCLKEGDILSDAAELAGAGGVSFTGVKAVIVLSPCDVYGPYDNFTSGGDQDLNSTHAHGHVHRIYDTDCPDDPRFPVSEFPHLGPSGVNWHGWVHEIGHSIQLEGHDMFSHPGGYSSGYDLMDSCYPCGETVYSLSGSPVVSDDHHTSFPGWLPSSKTIIIPKPSSGTAGGTYVLEPVNKPDPNSTVAPRGIKLPLDGDRSIFVEARTNVGSDNRSYGLFDEGVHLYLAQESANDSNGNPKPLTMLDACQWTVSGGCVYDRSDPRLSSCPNVAHLSESHGYCWPFTLWHVGDTFNDAINAIMVHVNGKVGDGYGVTVTRNVPPGHPDPFIYPWLTAPMNTYETVDIWVDSSCNGYEDTVGPSGLRYGRRGDGTVIGNGDDPCANHENRIYARVRNGGSVPANNVTVHFRASDPLGVGMTGSWSDVGSTTIPTIPAYGYRDVYVNWTPHVTLTPAEISSGHFNFHSCVQVHIDPIVGELVTTNNDSQENFDHFEAVRDPVTHDYVVPDRYFYLANNYTGMHGNYTGGPMKTPADFDKPIELRVKSELPPDWTYQVNGGVMDFTLAPHEVKQIPVKVQVPPGTPVAHTFNLRVTGFAQHHMINNAVPGTSPNAWHYGWMQENGVVEGIHTVDPSKLTITATFQCPDMSRATIAVPPAQLIVKGKLEPAHNDVVIAIDYTPPGGGAVQTHLVHTNPAGEFQDTLNNPAKGEWLVRALWQGDMDHSSSVSDEQKVEVGDCNKPSNPTTPTTPPPGSSIFLPENAFNGGLLTGVVLGPDDKPVPNTPVTIAGGEPGLITGEVIGEEPQPNRPKPTTPTGCPNCPPIGSIKDCAGILNGSVSPITNAAGVVIQGGTQPSNGVVVEGGTQPSDTHSVVLQGGLQPGQVMTDAQGRFALCVKPDTKNVDVSLGDGTVKTSVPTTPPARPTGKCDEPPQFFQPNQRIDFCKLVGKPTLTQGGNTWNLIGVIAGSPDGKQVINAVKTPRDLTPGPATFSFFDRSGQPHTFTGGVFKIVNARIDRSKLRSNEGADFAYDLVFDAGTAGTMKLCVNVTTTGPIVLTQAPPAGLTISGNGTSTVQGKIRATPVAPGSTVPFGITLTVHSCGK